jgi:hypothetical protein
MRTIGKLTTAAVLAFGATVAVVGIRSIPDIKRYLKIRQM